MTRDLGYREMLVENINWADGGERAERASMDHVRAMSITFEQTDGLINAPVVRKSDKKLWSGHDRVAAAFLAKRKKIFVHLMEGTDEEMTAVALIENLHRRHDNKDELKRRLVELRAARISGQRDTKLPTAAKPGRPLSPAGEARKQLAAENKRLTPEALKQAEKRERAKSRGGGSPAGGTAKGTSTAGGREDLLTQDAHTLPPVTEIETFGLPISDELLATVIGAQARIDKADRHLQQAQAELRALERDVPGYSSTKAQELHQLVHQVAHLVRSARPAALCHACKGEQIDDMSCFGLRFVEQGVLAGRPRELLFGGAAAQVSVNGRFMPLTEWRSQRGNLPENRGAVRESGRPRNGSNGGVGHGR